MTLNCETIKLKKGSNGEEVKKIQTILRDKGFYDGYIDGSYGDLTVNAVKLFQRSMGITVDGWIGSQTCQKLNKSDTSNSTKTNNYRDFIGKKFLIEDIKKATEVYRKHIKNNKNYPDSLKVHNNERNEYTIGRSNYMQLFESVSQFFVKNGREPNWVILNGTANNPLAIDYQDNSIRCGPASTSMCFQMMGKWITESQLAKDMNTNKSSQGTAPANLVKAVQKYGFEFKEIPRKISSVKLALDEGSPVLMHIHSAYSGGRSCLGYKGSFGHYIMCYGVSGNYYLLADPTKGFKKCYSTNIDEAKSSSNMKYYRLNFS